MGKTMYMRQDKAGKLFLLCWLAYFTSYLGRLNYAAVMAEILAAEGYSGAEAGLVGTGFFLCYGAGQLISGAVGDRIPPRYMVLFGLVCSAGCNIGMGFSGSAGAMLVLWCANGFIQSTLWTPVLRIIAEYLPPNMRKGACANMATTYPVATLLTYAATAGLVALWGWRSVFYTSGVLLLMVAVVWAVAFPRLEKYRTVAAEMRGPIAEKGKSGSLKLLPWAPLALLCGALAVQGVLRDGVMTWVPAYLSGAFGIGTAVAILTTAVLPVLNLAGVYVGGWLVKKLRSEAVVSALLFGGAALAGVLLVAGQGSLALSVLALALTTACMMGVNLALVSLVPTYFGGMGRVSFVAGLLNASVYVGSALATYGIGAVADSLGWNTLLLGLIAIAVLGGALCLLAKPGWKKFLQKGIDPDAA